MMADQDYYHILGVSKDAGPDQIKAAYRDLAFQYHPDKNKDNPDAAAKMKQLNEAYAVLSDPKKRQDYDAMQKQYGSAHAYTHFRNTYSDQDIFSGSDIHQVFDELAKSFGFRNFDEISKEFYGQKGKTFEFKNANIHFKGFVFSGTLSFDKLGKTAKTLLQNISGAKLSLHGKDLHDTIRIGPDLARNGGPYAYYHAKRSKKLVVKIPPNIRHGQQIRLAGMGLKGNGESGDLYLKIETAPSIISRIKKFLPF